MDGKRRGREEGSEDRKRVGERIRGREKEKARTGRWGAGGGTVVNHFTEHWRCHQNKTSLEHFVFSPANRLVTLGGIPHANSVSLFCLIVSHN